VPNADQKACNLAVLTEVQHFTAPQNRKFAILVRFMYFVYDAGRQHLQM